MERLVWATTPGHAITTKQCPTPGALAGRRVFFLLLLWAGSGSSWAGCSRTAGYTTCDWQGSDASPSPLLPYVQKVPDQQRRRHNPSRQGGQRGGSRQRRAAGPTSALLGSLQPGQPCPAPPAFPLLTSSCAPLPCCPACLPAVCLPLLPHRPQGAAQQAGRHHR